MGKQRKGEGRRRYELKKTKLTVAKTQISAPRAADALTQSKADLRVRDTLKNLSAWVRPEASRARRAHDTSHQKVVSDSSALGFK